MEQKPSACRIHVGQRNLKTALAATLCALVYLLVERNPTFACIGAIFGMGNEMEDSRLNGGNRFFGTVVGGVLGMSLFRLYLCFYPDGKARLLMLVFLFVGVVLLILAGQFIRWAGGIPAGGVVLCILLFSTPADHYFAYGINRIIDTGVGVAMALLVNKLLPRGRLQRLMETLRLRKKDLPAQPE